MRTYYVSTTPDDLLFQHTDDRAQIVATLYKELPKLILLDRGTFDEEELKEISYFKLTIEEVSSEELEAARAAINR